MCIIIPQYVRYMHCNAKAYIISISNVPGIFQIGIRLYVVGMVILNTPLKLTMVSDDVTTFSWIQRVSAWWFTSHGLRPP